MELTYQDKTHNPYYTLILQIEDCYALGQKIVEKFDGDIIDKNFEEFTKLIEFLYLCHYCPTYAENGYRHHKNFCYFVNSTDCQCESYYKNGTHQQSMFSHIWSEARKKYEPAVFDHVKMYISMKLIRVDEHNKKHEMKINFAKKVVSEMVQIIERSEVNPGVSSAGKQCHISIRKFTNNDPEIFLETYLTRQKDKEIFEPEQPMPYDKYLAMIEKLGAKKKQYEEFFIY